MNKKIEIFGIIIIVVLIAATIAVILGTDLDVVVRSLGMVCSLLCILVFANM